MKYTKWLFALVTLLLLAGCDIQPEPVTYTQAPAPQSGYVQAGPAPVVVQNSNDGLLTGLMIGHMMSGGGGGGGGGCGGCGSRTVVNKTVVNKTYVSPTPRPSYSARSSYSAPRSYGGSSFGGSRSFSSGRR